MHQPSKIYFTDGVKELAESCSAYWLIYLIISHQFKKEINSLRFQVWDLKCIKDNSFTITATDGNYYRIASQNIPYSDFCHDLATLWLVDDCLMQPKKY